MISNQLPPGVTRSSDIGPHVTLNSAQALCLWFDDLRCAIVWKHLPSRVRPLEPGKRLRDLRPGDEVMAFGELETITKVEICR